MSAAAAASMRFLSCFTCRPVQVVVASFSLSLLFAVVIAMRRRWRADYPKSRCRRPLRRSNPYEDKGDESSHRERGIEGDRKEKEGPACYRAQHTRVVHEGFMLYAEGVN